jgi:chaperonin GroEL
VIAEELGTRLESVGLAECGRARRVVIDKGTTTIIGGGGNPAAIQARCEQIRSEIKETTSDYDREKLEERLAKLSGGVAVIHAGAASESEMKSVKEAFEDAINSTKAAIAEGIVPGAGLSLLRAAEAVEKLEASATGDVKTGLGVLRRALEVPTRQLAKNSGIDDGVVIEKMRNGNGNLGLEATSGTYVDLLQAGIVDATKVVRLALENAVSVAGILLLTEATMTEIPEPKPAAPGAPLEY